MNINEKFILGIIPARSGSKGVLNKNIKLLNSKPLIYYTIEAAKKSKLLNDTVVSTDSIKIAEIVKKYDFDVPFLRPKNLAEDDTPTIPVLRHALENYEKKNHIQVSHVMLLQPTAPFRSSNDIDNAITLMMNNPDKESLISVCDAEYAHPQIMYKINEGKVVPLLKNESKIIRRQNFRQVFLRNGAIYLMHKDQITKENKMVGDDPLIYQMPRWSSVNIDSEDDFLIAELLMKNEKN